MPLKAGRLWVHVNLSGELESYLRGLDLNTPNAQELY